MNLLTAVRHPLRLGAIAVLLTICAGPGQSQDPKLAPSYGSKSLKSGFTPDPFSKDVIAGGDKEVTVAGVKMRVANAPDFSLNYTAGNLALSFYVRSKADTTLLINLPDGTWISDDDSDGNLNPALKLNRPRSGRYDIWVGTINRGSPAATLYITELR
jgi:hypothetical protein